ncbi:tetratricopeptide repeat protein, partial [Spirulina sp. 06S082]|uniref:tetratricopeptide repeat protein n=1 Tax=Spirulina sp. 06S082 TaxID=3110248 RepID=UPI002B202523
MAKPLGEKEFEKLERQSPAIFDSLDRWSPEAEEELKDLLRALRRQKGFNLFFVQCSPALGERIIEAIQERFAQKRLVRFELEQQSETLYWELIERYQAEPFEMACVTGIEQTLYAYEDTKRLAGWSDKEIYNYSWKGVPSVLSHLNRYRELFEANLSIALIFLVPRFAIDYFVQRAPDFFDWRSGFFKFAETSENLQNTSRELVSKTYKDYLALTSEKRMAKILEIKDQILKLDPSDNKRKSNLLREQGRIFNSDQDYDRALDCYNRALMLDSQNHLIWYSKGSLFKDLERYEEAIESFEHALYIKQEDYITWNQKGIVLCDYLHNYEEAIESFEHALDIQPSYHYAWHNKGVALKNLQRYKEAIENYDRALEIEPNDLDAWNSRGIALGKLQRNEEEIESYDRALKIQPEYHYAWYNRGIALGKLQRNEEAIESYDRALKIQPDYHYAWNGRGFALGKLQRNEEAIESYDRALKIQPDYHYAWNGRGFALGKLQ